MRKPSPETFAAFEKIFCHAAAGAGKEQYLVPYFMAGHPGCDLAAMIDLALELKRSGYRPDQVQDFIPAPMDIATCMYYTGIDPMSGEEVYVAKGATRAAFTTRAFAIFQARERCRCPRGPATGRPRGLDRRGTPMPDTLAPLKIAPKQRPPRKRK